MTFPLLASATWIHLLATVSMIGLYLVMYFAVTPAAIAKPAQAGIVFDAYQRAKPYILGGWLIFVVTGITLTLLGDQYRGLGQFNNLWSVLMLVKHIVILVMILMTGVVHACPVISLVRPLESALYRNNEAETLGILKRIHGRERVTMMLGVLILLLTAVAEMAQPGI
jgi:uncharacterized membrane protein